LKIKTYLDNEAINKEIELTGRVDVVCNLCRSNEAEIVARENGFNICRCLRCGLVYVNPQPTPQELDNYYRRYYPEINEKTIVQWYQKKSFNQVINILKEYHPNGGDLLDVGCGLGLFLEEIRRTQDHWSLAGLDLDKRAISYATRRHKNIQFIHGNILDISLIQDGSYDVITLLACLEHLHDPMRVLERAYQILRPGGTVIVRVPYITPWLYIKKYIPFLPVRFQAPMHLFDFSPRVLEKCLNKSGYENIRILIAAPDMYPNVLITAMIKIIKSVSILINIISRGKYILPLSGGLVGIGQKKEDHEYPEAQTE
jgi:SAM-dependent methyltransferase